MELTHVLGYLGAFFTGLVLGLLGGGGALLAIPILVYLFKISPPVATGYSLFLIAISASSGAFQNIRKKHINYKVALYYGIPSVITIFMMRWFVMPHLPLVILTIGSYQLSKDHFILLVLVIIMLMAAYKMVAPGNEPWVESEHKTNYTRLAIYAIFIGSFLGLVGSGGGFLMVPALIYFANLSPKRAIGTALLLVAVNSFIGFIGDVLRPHNAFDWKFLFIFSLFSIGGVLVGHQLTGRFDNDKLKKYFGWFIFIIAMIMIAKEVVFV